MLCAGLSGRELIRNGAFEDSLREWSVEYDTTAGFWSIDCTSEYDQDPDLEAGVFKGLMWHARLFQSVPVAGLDLRFAVRSAFYTATGGTDGYYAYAAVVLQYEDTQGGLLGRSMIIRKTRFCSLANTPTQHLIEIPDSDWHDHEFIVSRELASLPGVDPDRVSRLTVALESYGNGTPG
jgi:hypothetical protein